MRVLRGAAALLLYTAWSEPAQADKPRGAEADDPSNEARSAFEEGSRLYDLGEYDKAIARFERSYTLSGAPSLLLNIAQAHRLRGACAQAAAFYRKYLEKLPGSPHRLEVLSRIAEMDACGEPKGVATPLPPPAPTPAPRPLEPPPPPAAPPRPTEDASWKILTWTGVSLAVVGTGVGVTTGVLALGKQGDLDRVCRSDGGCPAAERGRIDDYDALRTTAIASSIVGGAGLVLVALGVIRPGAERKPEGATLQPWLGAGSAGLRGTF